MRSRAPIILNRLPPSLLLWLLVCCVFGAGVSAQHKSALSLTEPHVMREDFQGEGFGQWASYPPAQDVGYEPSLTPTSEFDAPGGRALMRVVKPNRTGSLRFGFIKQAPLAMTNGARLRFAYRLNAPAAGGASLEIGVAGGDGARYTATIPASANKWDVAEIALDKLLSPEGRALANDVRLDAVYLVAGLPSADVDTTYRFIIDDIALAAARDANFDVHEPPAVRIEPWAPLVSAKGYRSGETIAISATSPAHLARAQCLLLSRDGNTIAKQPLYDDGTHGDERAGDGVWSHSALHKISAADPAGVWSATLSGATASGQNVTTRIRFIHHPSHASTHPRLFFAAADREKLIARARDPKLASLWSHLQTTAKNTRATGALAHGGEVFELLDQEYLLPSLLAYFDILNRARSRIAHNALEAYITDSAEARSAAKSALLDVARWKSWAPPWFEAHGQHTYYPAGQLASDAALGYDLLYDHLTEAERSHVRRALIEKQIAPTYKEYVADNRVMANTSNWIAHTVGGALIAAAAIADDVKPEEANGKFELYLNGLLLKIEAHINASFLPDGSYGEGISYQEFDAETLGPMTVALRRAFGIDYFNTTHVKDSLAYALYILTEPTSASLDMGDTHPPAGHGIPALVYQSKDPVLRWYYARFERPSLQQFIFYDDTVAPQSPKEAKLPTSRIFAEKGNAVFRTGWGGADEIVLLFRAGANFNHHHADQGAFLLTAYGEPLITEAGWSDYYKDPYYATFFTQAVGHNTVLVDGNPESQTIPDTPQFKALDNYPRLTDSITSEVYDGVGGELSSVYQNRLARYTRRIVFVKPYYFVVFDDLKANKQPARFDFLLHLPNRDQITIENSTAIYRGEKASLAVRSFAPRDATLSVENGRIPYHVFSTRTPAETPAQPAYLDFKTTKPLSEAQFLTAIVPAKTEGAARGLINRMTGMVGENLKGIRVERGDEIDSIMFRAGAGNAAMRQGEWSAEAATVTIRQSANNLKMFAAQSARALRRGDQILFASEQPASVAVNFSANETTAVCNAETMTKIALFVGGNPVRVLLDGKELSADAFSFSRAGGTLALAMPAGQHDLKITLR